ncbi:hypothetical protein, partial [Aquabacterium sp.]|uniref:hypothetical protein n=1 Tax=Aquabacterium sp. TaxID=1872578 RepID=UPI0025C3C19A
MLVWEDDSSNSSSMPNGSVPPSLGDARNTAPSPLANGQASIASSAPGANTMSSTTPTPAAPIGGST